MKILFSVFFLCCITVNNFRVNAQEVFGPIGAEWHYYGVYYSFSSGVRMATLYHDVVTGDTVIQGINCRKLEQSAIAKTIFSGSGGVLLDTQKFRTLYLYNNTDTVFIFNENFDRFTPLYVFNVEEGDTVCLPVVPDVFDNSNLLYHPVSGDTSFCFQIDSIRTVYYDSVPLKTLYNHPITDGGGTWSANIAIYNWSYYDFRGSAQKGAYAQKIGGIQGGLLPTQIGNWVERPYFQNLQIDLRCYSDSITNIKLTPGNCTDLIPDPVGFPGITVENLQLSIYPNPAKEIVTIESPRPLPVNTVVVLTDITGKTVNSQQVAKNKTVVTMELTNMQAGIYLLKIVAGKYSANHKLVIY